MLDQILILYSAFFCFEKSGQTMVMVVVKGLNSNSKSIYLYICHTKNEYKGIIMRKNQIKT